MVLPGHHMFGGCCKRPWLSWPATGRVCMVSCSIEGWESLGWPIDLGSLWGVAGGVSTGGGATVGVSSFLREAGFRRSTETQIL